MGAGHALVLDEVVEEVLEVRAEVGDVAVGAHERQHLPVRVRALPEVPVVAADLEAGQDLGADRLDTVHVTEQTVSTAKRGLPGWDVPATTREPDHDFVGRR